MSQYIAKTVLLLPQIDLDQGLYGMAHWSSLNVLDADAKWLVWAESRFASIAGKDTDMDRESFKNALDVRNVFFADRFFDLLDNDHSGTVSQREMMDGLFLLTKGTKEEKLRFFFDVYDLDENGTIEKNELRALLKTGVEESSLQLSDGKVDHLTETLFNTADQNSDGSISFDEFMTALKRYPDLLENFSIGAAAWLKDSRPKRRGCRGIPWLRVNYLQNNIQRIALLLIIIVVTGVLFAEAAYRHSFNPDSNWCFLIARGCGQALNFNCAIIVLMMLRKTLSFLRSSTLLMQILPFDDNIMFHKFIGYLAAILALTHTLGHVGNALILETYKNFTAVELLFTNPTLLPVGLRVGKLVGSAFITGWILDIVFLILILGSLSYVRRSGHFEIFYWTHKICYFLFWFLLILHGPVFWAWFVGPLILFLLEKFSNLQIIRRLRHGKTYIKEANLLPSGVTHLVMTKPRHFKYKAGDYVFIKIPEIAMNEWHPFTISSAPEQAGHYLLQVDFIWLNRNHTAFEWFVDMLLNLEQGQSQYSLDRFLDIPLFMTGIQRFDMKNFGLQMALDLVHEQENRDLLTGLRTKLQAGRPNWNKLFKKIKDEDKGRVSVFFCGSLALGNVINKQCQKFGFIFHKENF
ncbi:NADPH oxidase 5-like [Acanthaster planci]|uniref:NADPH oxidase 5-like n=1 Tax=Acanthaster planci TaxID=133434 RepID=A0A8B8A1C7_ACAPL|nr:NADPH oxidase 5-like [Acanthaster planci]